VGSVGGAPEPVHGVLHVPRRAMLFETELIGGVAHETGRIVEVSLTANVVARTVGAPVTGLVALGDRESPDQISSMIHAVRDDVDDHRGGHRIETETLRSHQVKLTGGIAVLGYLDARGHVQRALGTDLDAVLTIGLGRRGVGSLVHDVGVRNLMLFGIGLLGGLGVRRFGHGSVLGGGLLDIDVGVGTRVGVVHGGVGRVGGRGRGRIRSLGRRIGMRGRGGGDVHVDRHLLSRGATGRVRRVGLASGQGDEGEEGGGEDVTHVRSPWCFGPSEDFLTFL
jgi:hypothetical protein